MATVIKTGKPSQTFLYNKRADEFGDLLLPEEEKQVANTLTNQQRYRQRKREERVRALLGPQADGMEVRAALIRQDTHALDRTEIARLIGITRVEETLTEEDGNRLLSIDEVAYALNVSRQTVSTWISRGSIGCLWLPYGHKRFRVLDVRRFIQGLEPAPSPAPKPTRKYIMTEEHKAKMQSASRKVRTGKEE